MDINTYIHMYVCTYMYTHKMCYYYFSNVDFIQEYLGGETWSVFIKCNIVVEFAMAKTVEVGGT